jgi:hypothetical protein
MSDLQPPGPPPSPLLPHHHDGPNPPPPPIPNPLSTARPASQVFILDRGMHVDGHVAILGATLWTDVLRVGPEHFGTLRRGIRDFDECLVAKGERFTLDDMGAAHAMDAVGVEGGGGRYSILFLLVLLA